MTIVRSLLVTCALCLSAGVLYSAVAPPKQPQDPRAVAHQLLKDGNFKEAFEALSKLALDPQSATAAAGEDLVLALDALAQLGEVERADKLLEGFVKAQGARWQSLTDAANGYMRITHHGQIVAGEFKRGAGGRGRGNGGKFVSSLERDRTRALQLLQMAVPLAEKDPKHAATARLYQTLASVLMLSRDGTEAWRLQVLSDLEKLPDYDESQSNIFWRVHSRDNAGGAPVAADGTPIYYDTPKSWAEAKNDGERWRWTLTQAVEMDANLANQVLLARARFSESQFGVQTLGHGWSIQSGDHGDKDESGVYALHTLKDNETIARLATGIKRFELPDDQNYIKLHEQIAASNEKDTATSALESLAGLYSNRRQYPRAAEYWQQVIKLAGPGENNSRKNQLQQIVGNWGRFEAIEMQPAGEGAVVDYRYRNGKSVAFEAHEIKVDQLFADLKKYLKSNPKNLDWNKLEINDLGRRLVTENQKQYLGKSVAKWDLKLEPREGHFDGQTTVTTPLQKSGAYLVTARMKDGNLSHIVVWVTDTIIVKKPLSGQNLYFVADAVTGRPVAKANLELLGFRVRSLDQPGKFMIDTLNRAEFTDAQGMYLQPQEKENTGNPYQWLAIARTKDGRLAQLGFTGNHRVNHYDQEYNATKVFAITDRPVYRPGQTVQYKFWVGTAKYDQQGKSNFAGQTFKVEIYNGRGDKVVEKSLTADEYGGLADEYELPSDAMLGGYQLTVAGHGGGSFRVEEYKKPEFEVLVQAPQEPVALGEKITATVEAKYYFGAPVTEATVKYKVLRSSHEHNWYPVGPWDWFYGRGYWWFGYDYAWYPGWKSWGCVRPIPPWWGRGQEPPEVVMEAELPIPADGKLKIEIDTALAKEIHGDQDHSYEITAEVVDASRRTIVGTGKVLVAREPFKVFVWVDRGHYQAGDTILAEMSAHTLAEKPVTGTGTLKLLKIRYDEKSQPVETAVETWELNPTEQGTARQQLIAAEPGQYRLSYTLTDTQGHSIEGGYVFTVLGGKTDAEGYRFTDLELVPDAREYRPGQQLNLLVNANRPDSTVLLFVRPANGVYLPPKVLRLDGKSTMEEIAVETKDMPNFFVEAVTVSGGKVHSEMKEIVVPPVKRILNIAVEPSAETYLPGQPAEVKVRLTDLAGKPFIGSTVLSVYDKSVEYISGGSNVPEIKEFFWKWRRSHYPQTETSLNKACYNLVRSGDPNMGDLGVFGRIVTQEEWAAIGGRRQKYQINKPEMARKGMLSEAAMPEAAAPAADMSVGVGLQGESGAAAPAVQPTVRSNFADTAFWAAALTTDDDGRATVKFDMPESLTTWKIKAWAFGQGTQVGEAAAEVITRKNILFRLQAPRFFIERDEVVLSAVVHNYLESEKSVEVALEVDGHTLSVPEQPSQTVTIAAGGETRVDWRVKVAAEGETIIRMKALTDEESDAVEQKFPVYVHGIAKTVSYAGTVRPDAEQGEFAISVPEQRRAEQSRLEVRYSPTLAGAMVDALPYLADYPYGCTEQTLNRFLPSVITQKVLMEMQLDLNDIQEKRTNLNAQEIGDDVERAKGWKRFDRNPVFDQDELNKMVKAGVDALTQMQLSDGGWGWFSGWNEQSYPHTTAVVVHGLQVAQQNDVAIVPDVLQRGVTWLKQYQQQQVERLNNGKLEKPKDPWKTKADNIDAMVYMVLVDAGESSAEMLEFLYRDRVELSVYSKAQFALALHKQGENDKLAMLKRNIDQFLVQDEENETAYLKLPDDNHWWYWHGDEIEALSYYLKLLARMEPKGEVAPRVVKYLLNNRKHGTYWKSTRDTAVAVEAMAEYLRAIGEQEPDMTVEVWMDGKKQQEVQITKENLFTFDNKFVLTGEQVPSGDHQIELRKKGTGPLYFNAYLTNFTLEDQITSAGLEIKVNRKYYKLNRVESNADVAGSRGQAVSEKREKYQRQELANLDMLKSGDLVEIELEIDSKNDYEYLMFEDWKAAGFEPVEVRSGYSYNGLGAYIEMRDNRVCFFVRSLARGKHSVSYRMRAEIPGKFSALPTMGAAMYAPELRANSDEIKLQIED